MAAQFHIVSPPRQRDYSAGYLSGLDDGQRFASLRFFWLGVAAGLLLAAFVALVVINGALS